jgi:hypothetical protein
MGGMEDVGGLNFLDQLRSLLCPKVEDYPFGLAQRKPPFSENMKELKSISEFSILWRPPDADVKLLLLLFQEFGSFVIVSILKIIVMI